MTPAAISLDPTIASGDNYGIMGIAVDPASPSTVLASTCNQGLWKSTDSGNTWSKVNVGRNSGQIDGGRSGPVVLDPTDSQVIYLMSAYGGWGIWKSTNGGVDFDQLFSSSDEVQNPTKAINYNGLMIPEIAYVFVDPFDHLHLVASFHDVPWKNYSDAGLVESLDGGAT